MKYGVQCVSSWCFWFLWNWITRREFIGPAYWLIDETISPRRFNYAWIYCAFVEAIILIEILIARQHPHCNQCFKFNLLLGNQSISEWQLFRNLMLPSSLKLSKWFSNWNKSPQKSDQKADCAVPFGEWFILGNFHEHYYDWLCSKVIRLIFLLSRFIYSDSIVLYFYSSREWFIARFSLDLRRKCEEDRD